MSNAVIKNVEMVLRMRAVLCNHSSKRNTPDLRDDMREHAGNDKQRCGREPAPTVQIRKASQLREASRSVARTS